MSTPLEELVCKCKKPLISGYLGRALLIYDNGELQLTTQVSADSDGNAHYAHHVSLKLSPKLPAHVEIESVTVNESGCHAALIGPSGVFVVKIPKNIWTDDQRCWTTADTESSHDCRWSIIGGVIHDKRHRTKVCKARWYVKNREELGQEQCNCIAVLYSDSSIRIYNTVRNTHVPLAIFDFSEMIIANDDSLKNESMSRLGLFNMIASFDFGPSYTYEDSGKEEHRVNTILAVDSEDAAIYIARFELQHKNPAVVYNLIGPFQVNTVEGDDQEVCDLMQVRHKNNQDVPLFALVTGAGNISHFVPVMKDETEGARDFELITVNTFEVNCKHGESDNVVLIDDGLNSARYFMCGFGQLFWVDSKPLIAGMMAAINGDYEGEINTETANCMEHMFCVLGGESDPNDITSACVVSLMPEFEKGVGTRMLIAALTENNELMSRCINVRYARNKNLASDVNSTLSLSQTQDMTCDISVSEECEQMVANRVTVPRVKLCPSVSEAESLIAANELADALCNNLSVNKDVFWQINIRMKSALERKKELENEYAYIDERILRVLRHFMQCQNKLYAIKDGNKKIRFALDRIHNALSARAPMLTEAEKRTLERLEEMQKDLQEQVRAMATHSEELKTMRKVYVQGMRAFQPTTKAATFGVHVQEIEIGRLSNRVREMNSQLKTLREVHSAEISMREAKELKKRMKNMKD